jgi:hypothetical protein
LGSGGWGVGLTFSAGSAPKFVLRKLDSVTIRSKFTADRNNFPNVDQVDEFQGARADHWRGGLECTAVGCRGWGEGVRHADLVLIRIQWGDLGRFSQSVTLCVYALDTPAALTPNHKG